MVFDGFVFISMIIFLFFDGVSLFGMNLNSIGKFVKMINVKVIIIGWWVIIVVSMCL